jgi:DNA excision repair protein ERCC-1
LVQNEIIHPTLYYQASHAQCLRITPSMDDARPRDAAAAVAAAASASKTAQTSRPADTPTVNANPNAPRVQQPKPQALPSRSGPSSILVSPRQKGNPILNSVRTVAWEYSDIPADYVLGATTCALFLSLKYHRLHPEYIYNRIRDLKGQYQLRVLLVMVDIENHEESLRELSKTSLINNVTIMLTWSAQEAGRYLELFKTFEHAAPTSIKAQQSSTYSDSMVEFITVPRSINKTDAVGLVSNFGSIRTAINAGPEEIGLIAGWGTKKVQRWCNSVREPFRIKKAAKRGPTRDNAQAVSSRDISLAENESRALDGRDFEESARARVEGAVPIAAELAKTAPVQAQADADARPSSRIAEEMLPEQVRVDGEELVRRADAGRPLALSTSLAKRKPDDETMNEGIMAALSKLRKQ